MYTNSLANIRGPTCKNNRFAVLANEYNAITSIFSFWSDKVPIWGYFLLFWVSFAVAQETRAQKMKTGVRMG